MALQDIINSAVNVEINRSQLVAQTVSRSGRISVASRSWTCPFRFVVTPQPVWSYEDYRSVFAELLDGDRYLPMTFTLNDIDPSTFRANLGNSWMVPYQGGGDVASGGNNTIDSYSATTDSTGAKLVLTNINSTTITAGIYLAKKGDYLRAAGTRYPHIATADVVIPTAVASASGVVQPAGVTISLGVGQSNLSYVSTTTHTAVTAIASTTGMTVGQVLTKISGAGAFNSFTYISSVDSATQISIQTATAATSGGITFSGSGNTSEPAVAIPIHRGFIGTLSGNAFVRVGARAAAFNVIVSKLPQVRYLPGRLVELTGDIELIEEVL
jgi:hypothetical protein